MALRWRRRSNVLQHFTLLQTDCVVFKDNNNISKKCNCTQSTAPINAIVDNVSGGCSRILHAEW